MELLFWADGSDDSPDSMGEPVLHVTSVAAQAFKRHALRVAGETGDAANAEGFFQIRRP